MPRTGPRAPAGTGAFGNIDDRQRALDSRNCDEPLADHDADAEWFRALPGRQHRLRTDASGDIVLVRKLSSDFSFTCPSLCRWSTSKMIK
jgi:hypothetical protein